MGKLTVAKINGLKPSEKEALFYDGDYLYLRVSPKGKKVFLFKGYRFKGAAVGKFVIGEYDNGKGSGTLSLRQARDTSRAIIQDYQNGIDYKQRIKNEKEQYKQSQENTFNDWFYFFLDTKKANAQSTMHAMQSRADNWLLPIYAKRPIDSFTRKELIEFLESISKKEKYTTRNKVANILHGVFELALNREVIPANPASNIIKALSKKPAAKHHPALTTSSEVAKLACDIYNRKTGTIEVNSLVKFSLHVMLRPKEARSLKWVYVDFDDDIIRLPPNEIKTAEYHVVPMSKQVKSLLIELHDLTGLDDYVFSLPDNKEGFPSENAVNSALHSLGYKGKQVAHGFRTTASSQLNECGLFDSDAIEKQLAHNDRSQIRAVYNRADYLKIRREMLQYWSDLIDKLRNQ